MKPAKWRKLHASVWFDVHLIALGPEARVCYGTMLLLASDEGHIARFETAELACLVGLTLDRVEAVLPRLVSCGYVSCAEGQYTVSSQVRDYAFSESRRAGGRARYDLPDAKHRAKHLDSDAKHPEKDAKHQPKDAKHRPSGSSSGEEKNRDPSRVKQEHEKALSRQVSDYWLEAFMRARGVKYVWQGGKDGKALSALLKANPDVQDIRDRIDRFLADPFWAPKADWMKFCSQFNAMAPSKPSEPAIKPIDPEVVQDFIRRREASRMAQGSGHPQNVDPARSQAACGGSERVA